MSSCRLTITIWREIDSLKISIGLRCLQDEDYDEQEEERILNEKDEDEYVLSKMCEVMRAIFSTYKTDALPLFQQLMVHVVKLLVGSFLLNHRN